MAVYFFRQGQKDVIFDTLLFPYLFYKKAACCFIGGSTDWKLDNANKFKGVAVLLHIGRVTTLGRLRWAKEIGADSVDGSGFFRGKGKQYYDFINWFEGDPQIKMEGIG